MSQLDYEAALASVDGDEAFLIDVLKDLLKECKDAEDDIQKGIESEDYTIIMKAAHTVKGSSSYLFCEQLRVVSLELQDQGRLGQTTPSPGLLTEIEHNFKKFKICVRALREEVCKISG